MNGVAAERVGGIQTIKMIEPRKTRHFLTTKDTKNTKKFKRRRGVPITIGMCSS